MDILAPGDGVMADKGFNIKDELASVGAVLEIPSFLKKGTQFTEEEINKNKAIASLRIHVERQMERIKNWHILDRRMPITMAPYASDIVVIIHLIPKWRPINYSFVCTFISPLRLVNMYKKQKNFVVKTR